MTRINTNVSSLAAQKSLTRSNAALTQSLTRLSTGLRINTGKDDPAGLIASEFLRSDIASMKSQIDNAQRSTSMISTADSSLSEVALLLVDVRGISSLAASMGGMTDNEQDATQEEIDAKIEAIDKSVANASYNGQPLLTGRFGFKADSASLGSAATGRLESLKSGGVNDLASGHSTEAAAIVAEASSQVARYRGDLGAQQKTQLETTLKTLSAGLESLSAAQSALRDADFAVEMAGLVRSSILTGGATKLVALASASATQTLILLGG